VCDQCVLSDHEDHLVYERYGPKLRPKHKTIEEIQGRHCEGLSVAIETAIRRINQQHDIARERVMKQFSYQKKSLEKWRDNSLEELEYWRAQQESGLKEILTM